MRPFVCELILRAREVKVGGIEPDSVSYLVLDCWMFLFVVLSFHLVSGSLE